MIFPKYLELHSGISHHAGALCYPFNTLPQLQHLFIGVRSHHIPQFCCFRNDIWSVPTMNITVMHITVSIYMLSKVIYPHIRQLCRIYSTSSVFRTIAGMCRLPMECHCKGTCRFKLYFTWIIVIQRMPSQAHIYIPEIPIFYH